MPNHRRTIVAAIVGSALLAACRADDSVTGVDSNSGPATQSNALGAGLGSAHRYPGATANAAGLTVNISGPTQVPMYSSNKYTANVSGGTPPYDYKWRVQEYSRISGWGPWSNYSDTGTQNYTYTGITSCSLTENHLQVLVTDATQATASSDIYIYITNPC